MFECGCWCGTTLYLLYSAIHFVHSYRNHWDCLVQFAFRLNKIRPFFLHIKHTITLCYTGEVQTSSQRNKPFRKDSLIKYAWVKGIYLIKSTLLLYARYALKCLLSEKEWNGAKNTYFIHLKCIPWRATVGTTYISERCNKFKSLTIFFGFMLLVFSIHSITRFFFTPYRREEQLSGLDLGISYSFYQ